MTLISNFTGQYKTALLLTLCFLSILTFQSLSAQSAVAKDSVKSGCVHQLGFQANRLIRELLPFNATNSTLLVNPYALIYSVNGRKRGLGARIGVGYNQEDISKDDGITSVKTSGTRFDARLGIEKMFWLSGRWTAGVGIDGVVNTNNSNTNTLVQSFDSTRINIQSKNLRFGGGVQGWVRVAVSKNILIGTESSFYYLTGTDKSTVSVSRKDFNSPGAPVISSTTKTSDTFSSGIFSIPVALYLIIRF